MAVRCFWVEPTGTVYRYLRRYTNSRSELPRELQWTCEGGWHQAKALLDEIEAAPDERGFVSSKGAPDDFAGHPRWPTECEKGCGYEFTTEPGPTLPPAEVGDSWQVAIERVYAGDGGRWAMRDLPPGAMYDAAWLPFYKGPDGKTLTVVLPDNTQWYVDGRASNCNRPTEPHYCWPRTGEPPNVTVDKNLGDTCSAGAGSIATSGYHGFLRGGELVPV